MPASITLPQLQHTKPETFILESLSLDDELASRFDGKVLHDILKLHGKEPIYCYFRTQRELIEFAQIFRESGYRYLHLSCHGGPDIVQYTFGSSSYKEFAGMFDGRLGNRRLFVSGCELGNFDFAKALFSLNGGMYSLTAPTKKVFFDQSISFWSAFYYMMHAWDSTAMKKKRLEQVLSQLATIFEMPLAHYFKNTANMGAVDEQIFDAQLKNLDKLSSKSTLVSGDPGV